MLGNVDEKKLKKNKINVKIEHY